MKTIKLYEEFINELAEYKFVEDVVGGKKYINKYKDIRIEVETEKDLVDYLKSISGSSKNRPNFGIERFTVGGKKWYTNHIEELIKKEGIKFKDDKKEWSSSDIKKLKKFAEKVSDEIFDEYEDADEDEYSPESMFNYIEDWGDGDPVKDVIKDFDWTDIEQELGLR